MASAPEYHDVLYSSPLFCLVLVTYYGYDTQRLAKSLCKGYPWDDGKESPIHEGLRCPCSTLTLQQAYISDHPEHECLIPRNIRTVLNEIDPDRQDTVDGWAECLEDLTGWLDGLAEQRNSLQPPATEGIRQSEKSALHIQVPGWNHPKVVDVSKADPQAFKRLIEQYKGQEQRLQETTASVTKSLNEFCAVQNEITNLVAELVKVRAMLGKVSVEVQQGKLMATEVYKRLAEDEDEVMDEAE
ncbi:hypothetical protein CALCODRAFT_513397 [Calocera cornea HHB12733]|uniref:Uncharacterized protein n=1 Tax=Calocera cornea HHB12733 TaxID=1353952 RepID=A0A165C5C5_9BASI|nr:hypothetical protein CALCODRAFT_513397 [Calocera cornea HHB12733]